MASSDFTPGAALPRHPSARHVLRRALPALAPVARVTVAAAATRRNVEAGGQWIPWRNDVIPTGAAPSAPVVVNIHAADPAAFKASRGQIAAGIARAAARGRRGL